MPTIVQVLEPFVGEITLNEAVDWLVAACDSGCGIGMELGPDLENIIRDHAEDDAFLHRFGFHEGDVVLTAESLKLKAEEVSQSFAVRR